jgi:hypothetical protein
MTANAADKIVTLNDNERAAITKELCDAARYANRMLADQVCAYFEKKFADAPVAEPKKDDK